LLASPDPRLAAPQNCLSRGHICEMCDKRDVIFPFQGSAVAQCPHCHALFHALCFQTIANCPKCMRIESSKRKRAELE